MSSFRRSVGLGALALLLAACKSPPSSTETAAAALPAPTAAAASAAPVAAAPGVGTPEDDGLMASVDFEDEAAREIAPQNYEQELDILEKDLGK